MSDVLISAVALAVLAWLAGVRVRFETGETVDRTAPGHRPPPRSTCRVCRAHAVACSLDSVGGRQWLVCPDD
ncbi:hypothetical protein ACH4E7_35455 [Kitasatospora sp. NPDC018058]|uniref:hypothetical protein n=1 Tax=Kitasatospora sp. NPDC018058 TaxID=3364025 RepID=UPI0037C0D58F